MSAPLYMRVCDMNIGGRVLTYPPMTLEFESDFSDRTPSQTKVKVYNPAPETVSACEKNGRTFPLITITAGYQEDFGTCAVGEIIKFEEKRGRDHILELSVSDKTSLWAGALVNKSWSGRISARDAATQILRDFGVTPTEIVFATEKSYENGLSFAGISLRGALERIARETGSRFRFSNGQASFLVETAGSGSAIVLGYDSGLLEASKTSSGFKVRSLFMYKIQGGGLVVISRGGENSNVRVRKGKHVFSSTGQAYTEFEATLL